MECEFHVQDPTSADTVYLLEAIIKSLRGATLCTAMFAFATEPGVDSLIGDPETQEFLRHSRMSLLVGLDAVTSPRALRRLRELEHEYDHLCVRVFWNPRDALFHMKLARFEYPDGSRSVIVGSGNLTPGGLYTNFEAFSLVHVQRGETLDVSSWDRFLSDHERNIRGIDEEAIDRAERNIAQLRRQLHELNVTPQRRSEDVASGDTTSLIPVGGNTDRYLIAQVPKAGNRWTQVHFNLDVIEQFFRIKHDSSQRVYLWEVHMDGTVADQEVRPCVYSQANKNLKIEVAARHGEPYPTDGVPIAVYRELHARSFAYMVLLPGDTGYDEMVELNRISEPLGRGLRRVITGGGNIRSVWEECPLLGRITDQRAVG